MQISSITDIVEGKLVSSPSISFIYEVKTDLRQIHEGDLFIVKNIHEIDEAIQKGAFALLYDFDAPITDKEIAWIKVNDIDLAITKLLRYKLSTLELNAYYCDKVTFELLKIFIKPNNNEIKLISNNLSKNLSVINNTDDINCLTTIISSDKDLLNHIYPNNNIFPWNNCPIENLIEHSLFETTFSYDNHYLSRIRLSSLYIKEFLNVYNFLNYNLDSNRLKKFNYFKPIFIDKYFSVIDYGYSNKFILSQIDTCIAKNEISYLKDKYKYAKTIVVSSSLESIDFKEADFYTNDINQIKTLLQDMEFNALYIVGFTNESILSLTKKNSSKTLL